MSQSPEAYNQTVGPALTVLVMDAVRELVKERGHVTQPQLFRHLGKQLGHAGTMRGRLYHNVQSRVRALRQAGLLCTEKKYHNDGRTIAFTLIITLPPNVRS